MIKRMVREPLLHFLLLGAGLFIIYDVFNQALPEQDPQTIVVDRGKLLTYIQYRAKAFDPERFKQVLDQLPQDELQQVIDDYVREEALYREAKALQLDKNDYVARLRLIQQLEFITRGFADTDGPILQEADLEHYYEQHKYNYYVEPVVTFTHVFFNQERRGPEHAETLAQAGLKKLNGDGVTFNQAPGHGDRFYYHVNYVKKEPEEIGSHFGRSFQEQVFALTPSENVWYGPFQSNYGFHLVMITENTFGYIPSLTEVRDKVEEDARREAKDKRFDVSIKTIVDAYKVKVDTIQNKS